jgi:hypothetical protein
MQIGEYEVTNITRNSAEVGCTTVTREEAQKLLEKMDAVPETPKLTLRVGTATDTTPGTVFLRPSAVHAGEVVLQVRGANGYPYNVLRIGGPKGIKLYSGVGDDAGIPVNEDGHAIVNE